MKLTFLFALFLLCITSLSSQPWTQNLPSGKSRSELTFFDYQQALEAYWAPFHLDKGYYLENGKKKKARGWKQFKRWEYAMQSEINPRTGAFPKKTAQQVFEEYSRTHSQPRNRQLAQWTSLGPDNSNGGYSGVGRINCIAFDPTDLNTYWIGAAAGGLWVTHDNGDSWTCLTDNNGVLAVSSIVIPSDFAVSHTIYIGTGDRDSYDNRSIGVLKSTDAGQTWNTTGLSYTIFENEMVNKLLIDPANSQILYAATTNGVYKTSDAGAHWNSQLTSIQFIDIEFKPDNPNTIYGSTKDGTIYLTNNAATFNTPVFEDSDARRIEIAVSPDQPTWVYAVASNNQSGLYGVYKSINSGASFQLVLDGNDKNILGYESDGSGNDGQGYYDLCIAANPNNANVVLIGGVNTWGTPVGGNNWQILNHWYGDMVQAVHADKHALVFRSNGDVFECNDGGVYVSEDNGGGWLDKTNGIVNSQMYRLGVSQTDGDDIITGLQDNGTKIHSNDSWFDQIGGDGMECAIDYTDVNIQYATLYYGQIFRTMDHWQSNNEITTPGEEGAWITPYLIDPLNPEILFVGYSEVFQSLDRGDNWFQISDFGNPNSKIDVVSVAPSNDMVLYISFGFNIWKTTDGGGDWTNVTHNLPVSDAFVNSITVSNDDPEKVWVALSGYTNPGVYETTDGGLTWNNISEGLPPIPTNTVVQNKLLMSDNLYAGTDLGVYFRRGNEPWARFTDGLPNVIVRELEIYYAAIPQETKLRAATYGRGLWETPIPFSSTPVSLPETTDICDGTTAQLTLLEYEGSIQWQSSPDGVNNWTNVTEGVGANTDNYTTGMLYVVTYFRAEITHNAEVLYSNTTVINVFPIPEAAGPVAGDTSVCQGETNLMFSVDPIPNAGIYIWTLPGGVTGTSSTASIMVNIGPGTQSGKISVFGRNGSCDGPASSIDIKVTPRPSKPLIGSVVQPTCDMSSGQVTLNNLPATGEWTLTRIPGDLLVTGTGTSGVVTGLDPGNYSFTVANNAGCVSVASSTIVIHAHASNPATPVVILNGNLLTSDAPAGNQWYNDEGIISGETGQEFIATENGNYYTIVTLNGCISDTSNVITIEMTAVDPLHPIHSLKVYPNPVKDELIIEVPGNNKVMSYQITNAIGQIVHRGEIRDHVIVKMRGNASGMYEVKITDGAISKTRKIVKS